MSQFISVKRNASIRERLHYISEAIKLAYKKPNSYKMFDAITSPLYLFGSVYDNFKENRKEPVEIYENFCLLQPDKFDCNFFQPLKYIYSRHPVKGLMFIDI